MAPRALEEARFLSLFLSASRCWFLVAPEIELLSHAKTCNVLFQATRKVTLSDTDMVRFGLSYFFRWPYGRDKTIEHTWHFVC